MTDITVVLIIAPIGRLRDSLRVLLRASNHIEHVDQADNVFAGLRMAADFAPALVLLDVNAPGNGIEQDVRQIRALRPRPACVVLTYAADQERQARAAGADGILQAGASAEAFFATVEGAIQKSREIEG